MEVGTAGSDSISVSPGQNESRTGDPQDDTVHGLAGGTLDDGGLAIAVFGEADTPTGIEVAPGTRQADSLIDEGEANELFAMVFSDILHGGVGTRVRHAGAESQFIIVRQEGRGGRLCLRAGPAFFGKWKRESWRR